MKQSEITGLMKRFMTLP